MTTLACSMQEAKRLTESTPLVVLDSTDEPTARDLTTRLKRAGADAEAPGPGDFRSKTLGA